MSTPPNYTRLKHHIIFHSVCILLPLFMPFTAAAQQETPRPRTLSGTVTSAVDGKGLARAVLFLKNNNIKTESGRSGTFELTLKKLPDTLQVRLMGYHSRQLVISSNTSLDIVLQPLHVRLPELTVSTGYQKIPKDRATGAFDKIDNELYNRSVSTDIFSRLENITSSLYFSKNTSQRNLYIRGISTLSGDYTSPLIILDDFPYEGKIEDINPNDVKDITILKDAAAASIWGAKSGNGVIVINTKNGQYNQPFHLSFNSNFTVQKRPNIFYDRNFIDADTFIDLEEELFSKGFYDATLNSQYRPIVTPVIEILSRERSGEISHTEATKQIRALREQDVRKDLQKYFYRNSFSQQYSMDISGGSNRLNYMLSLGYDKNPDILIGNTYSRKTLYSTVHFKPIKRLEIQSSVQYHFTTSENNSPHVNQLLPSQQIYPYAQLADNQGNALSIPYQYRMAYLDTAGKGLLLDWNYRPLDELKYADNTRTGNEILVKLGLTYHLTSHLSASVKGQLEKGSSYNRNYHSQKTYLARSQINLFTEVKDNEIIHHVPLGGILNQTHGQLSAYAFRGQLNYSSNWKNGNQLAAIVGAEVRQTHRSSQSSQVYGYEDQTLSSSPVDYVSLFPLYGNLGYNYILNQDGFSDLLRRYVSTYLNASYTFDQRYVISASARKDASNLFGVKTNQKGVPLWSVGTSWRISNESFYKSKTIPYLRFRLTYGVNGNVINNLASMATIRYSSGRLPTNLPYAAVENLTNTDLRWERVKMLNIGIDFKSKENRYSGSIAYYHKNAIDLIAFTPIDPTLGITGMQYNTANLSGNGIDIKINALVIKRALRWNILGLFNYVKNRVTQSLEERTNLGSFVGSGTHISPLKGKDPYALISYRWAGLDSETGNPIGYLNGKKSTDYSAIIRTTDWSDLIIGGTTRTPYYGSILNQFSWKGLSLSANLSFEFGAYFRKNTINYDALYQGWAANEDFYQRWQKPGDETQTNVPSMIYPSNSYRSRFYINSQATVEDAGLIRLKDINLSYTFKDPKFSHGTINNLKLYIYCNNVGLIWVANDEGIDPKYGNAIPAPVSIAFGLHADF